VPAQDSRGSFGGGDAGSASSLRRGKWTVEEEAYALRLIAEFKEGMLPLTDGTTLRTFLAKLLNCDPMRISKKFVGKKCIGKVRTYDLYSPRIFAFPLPSILTRPPSYRYLFSKSSGGTR
jgi:hypothetical protein